MFAFLFFFYYRVFVSSREVEGILKCSTPKAAAMYWRHSSDRQRTTSGDKIRAGTPKRSPEVTGSRNGFSRGYSGHLVSELI